ncbi:UNVERIFIED_CONTAM: carbon monoxide dehydrogenase subunit G [Williamsia faeni]
MTRVREEIAIAAPPASVWSVMGSPASLAQWHPGIDSSSESNGSRRCTMVGGGEVTELIVEHSDEDRYYVYAVEGNQFGMVDYQSRIQVEGAGEGSRVVWSGEFEAARPNTAGRLVEAIASSYRAGLESLRDKVESATRSN